VPTSSAVRILHRNRDRQKKRRFGYANILDVERGEPNSEKIVKIVLLKDGNPVTLFLPTKELTQREVIVVYAFINRGWSETPESVTEGTKVLRFQKPKNGTSKPKLSGLDYLEKRLKPKESGITVAVTTTMITAVQSRFKLVTVWKTYMVMATEDYVLPMTIRRSRSLSGCETAMRRCVSSISIF